MCHVWFGCSKFILNSYAFSLYIYICNKPMWFLINYNLHSKSYTTQSYNISFWSKKIFSLRRMVYTKKLLKMAKKWQQRAALHRKRISFQRSSITTSSPAAEKGCFVVYTLDKSRFSLPVSCLSNSVLQELLIKDFWGRVWPPSWWTNHVTIWFGFLGVSHQTDRKTNGWRYGEGFVNVSLQC